MCNTYVQQCDYRSRFRILKKGRIALVVSAFLASTTLSFAAPSGGVVTSGNAAITQNGVTTTIDQSSQKASINWSTFSIGSTETVNFNQPNTSSITLNRVIGNEKSVIDGALNANGQVWILNSNGVLFSKNASINTSGLIATTKSLSDADFQAGNYTFGGDSKASVINLGTIEIANGGYAALLANTVSNEGTIRALKGTIELVGGDEFAINLNGNSLVNITVTKGVLDALVENKGALIAHGGEIYLTTNAVNDLLKGVVNNTGVIEAQTLDDVTGKIELYAHGGTVNADGTLDASAPISGNGGYIETSGQTVNLLDALYVTTLAKIGSTGTWLIDPTTYTIAASGGNETGASLASRLASSNIEIQADNTITLNDAVSWNANKLTLNSGGNIYINADLIATGTASLAFYYGQSTAAGTGSLYSVADGIDILIPTASAFTWKKGSSGTLTNLVLDNGLLRFGDGSEASIDDMGSLLQPWYFDNVTSGRNDWYQLTYSSYPLDLTIGVNGSGYNDGNLYSTASVNYNGVTTSSLSSAISNLSINIAKYYEKTGTIEVSMDVTTSAGVLPLTQSYTLDSGVRYMKAITTISNTTGADITNARLWIGTQDDYVAENDSNYKTRGNISSDGFTAVTNQSSDTSKALIISEDTLDSGNGAAVLFYSTTEGTNTIVGNRYRWQYILGANPSNMADYSLSAADSSYALYLNLGTLANGQTGSVTWYYAAAPVSELSSAVTQVATSSGVTATPTQTITTPPSVISAIVNNTAVEQPRVVQAVTPQQTTLYTQQTTYVHGGESITLASTSGDENANTLVSLSEIRQMQRTNSTSSSSDTTQQSTSGESTGVDISIRIPLSRGSLIDIVDGGVKLPEGIEQEFYVLNQTH